MAEKSYTLQELNNEVKYAIESNFSSTVWLVAEINRLTINRSGHCYLELVQKSSGSDKIIASARGTIWASKFMILKTYFESTTGSQLTNGINVLVKVSIDFHEVYGLSLNIRDIDPAFTLGDIAKRRNEIIEKLKSENIINMNQSLSLPSPIQRVAVISSSTAAGYEDFINHISNNNFGYKFEITLFEASMQGDKTESSIISAFNSIFEKIENYDCVAIIRGGGSKSDLVAFDNYNIAFYITQFPLPVLSGIGHERDESVTDIVAHTKLKTPTAVATFIIENCNNFENEINNIGEQIADLARDRIYVNNLILTQAGVKISRLGKRIREEKELVNNYSYKLRNIVNNYLNKNYSKLDYIKNKKIIYSKELVKSNTLHINNLSAKLKSSINNNFQSKQRKIEVIEKNVSLTDPKNVLKRGFSITKLNNKTLKNSKDTADGDEIITVLYDSQLVSKVVKKGK